jgi:hypothetical protein
VWVGGVCVGVWGGGGGGVGGGGKDGADVNVVWPQVVNSAMKTRSTDSMESMSSNEDAATDFRVLAKRCCRVSESNA